MTRLDSNIKFDVLWQTWQQERKSSMLQPIDKNFYKDAFEFYQSIVNSGDQELKANIIKILSNIIELRKQKLLSYVAYNKPIQQNLPKEELDFYKEVAEFTKTFKDSFFEKSGMQAPKKENQGLKVKQEIPEIILPSGNKIGPLQKNNTIYIDNESDADFLINSGICTQ
ncbi:MAG: hypothetical protein QXN59_01810 [Candidatus Micrarchaeaceae archaeon]